MQEKEFKTYNEMLSLLESRNIDLSSAELKGRAKRVLQHEGYYKLINGYKMPFLSVNTKGEIIYPETYKSGTTIDEIYSLYSFDRRLRSICLNYILQIETNLKNIIAYAFSSKHGHRNYLTLENFDTSQKDALEKITRLFSNIQKQLSNRWSDPSIKHYLSKHGYIPLWVLNNILTLGDVSKFYSLMKQPERQYVSKIFNLSDKELISILTYLSSVRNICAHDNRLYCFRTRRPVSDLTLHSELNIPVIHGEYTYGKRDLFALMIIFKILLSRNQFRTITKQIRRELFRLKGKLFVLSESDVLSEMGFPNDWYQKLI